MWAVLFQNADGKDAGAFRQNNGVTEIVGGELFPMDGKFLLGGKSSCRRDANEQR